MRVLVGKAVLVAVAVTATAACAGVNESNPVPAEAYSLRADGTVPWVDERVTTADLFGPAPTTRTPRPGSRPCTASQLTGVLDKWSRPGNAGETPRGFDAAISKLIGEVDIRNTSAAECTLRGEVPTRLLAAGREVPMQYVHGINDEARRRVVVVPAGGHANLRLDWSGPFCQPVEPPLRLAIELPEGGGTLTAAVTPTDTPNCPGGEGVNPNARATLHASGFSEPARPSEPQDSPLTGLTIAITGPDHAAPGERLVYHAVLTNPTTTSIPLDPCPGYLAELYSLGDATNAAVNTSQLYRLNCRPVHAVPAGGSLRFEMVVQVPASMSAGRQLSVTWRLVAARFAAGPKHWGTLTVQIR